MRRTIFTLLAGLMLLSLAAAASAQQSDIDALRATVKQLSDQLKAVTDKLQELEAKQAAPAAAPAAAAPAKENWYDKLAVTGYWQSRYEAREDTRDEFIMRRMYLHFAGNWSQDLKTLLTLSRIPSGTDPNIELEAAQVNWRFADDYSVTFGQIYNNFGYDTWESSAKRLPFDRWAAGEGVAGRPGRPGIRGLYFRGPADRGIYLARHAGGNEPTVIAGLVNGNYNMGDNDDNKALSLDLRFNRPGNTQFGASMLYGDYTDVVGGVGVTQPRKALGLYFHTEPCPWGFQAEYLKGEMFGADAEGFYGQVAHNKGGKGTPYVRYEQFNQNENATGDTYTSLRLGYAYQLDKRNEFTFEYQDADAGPVDYGQLGAQWQFAF
ncbi:MAG: porin [Armatimonadota bacterium]